MIAFEPVPHTFAMLVENLESAALGHVTFVNAAATREPARLKFDVPQWEWGGLNYYQSRVSDAGATEVVGLPVDAVLPPGKVTFVKVDVEGHELACLHGCRRLLERDHPMLMVEGDEAAVRDFLAGFGYTGRRLDGSPNTLYAAAGATTERRARVLAFIKGLIKSLLPLGMYLGSLTVCVRAAMGKPHYAVFLIAVLTPLPNMWYAIHQFPLGKDVIDLLVISGFIGVLVGHHRQGSSSAGWFLLAYLMYVYLEVWNASLRYDLPVPLTSANGVFTYFKNYAEMGLLYAISYHATNDEKNRRTLVWICMAVFFLIVLREARNFTESVSFAYDKRAAGPFWMAGLGPNHFAAFVVHYAAVALGLSFFIENKYARWFLWLTSLVALAAAVLRVFARRLYRGLARDAGVRRAQEAHPAGDAAGGGHRVADAAAAHRGRAHRHDRDLLGATRVLGRRPRGVVGRRRWRCSRAAR